MQFSSTKHATQATGINYFCLSQPCNASQLTWEYKGIIVADTNYLVRKDACEVCGNGKLNSIPISGENTFEYCINLLLNNQHSSAASLILLFNEIAADFDHSIEMPSKITTTSKHTFASRTANLWIDNFITDNEINLDSVVSLFNQEQGIFAEYRNWWLAYIPSYLWGSKTKGAIEHFFAVLEKRHEEYLDYGNDNYLVIDIEPSIEKLKTLNERMYFEIGSAFCDIQLAIESELNWLANGQISSVSIFDIHYALAVINQYKNATLDSKSKFRLVRDSTVMSM